MGESATCKILKQIVSVFFAPGGQGQWFESLTWRNTKFLWAYKPALTQKELIVTVSQDVDPEFELESAWEAKGLLALVCCQDSP